jgi:hypothetical protein
MTEAVVVVVDWTDPCAAYAALLPQYYALLAGKAVTSVKFVAGNASGREVTYNKGLLADFRNELTRLKDLCALANGQTVGRRHVTIAG